MNFNMTDLTTSDFWIKNLIEFDHKNKTSRIVNQKKWVMFTTNQINQNKLENWEIQEFSTSVPIHPELYGNLRTNTLSIDWQKEIIKQWVEVANIIRSCKIEPIMSWMMICKPGSYIHPHSHNPKIKQTLTICYNFLEHRDFSYEKGQFSLLGETNVIKKVEITNSSKTILTWKNNCNHDASTDTLTFFWIHDFLEFIDLPSNNINGFDLMNLD